MLQTNAIAKEAFALLKRLMAHQSLANFSLGGGTGLALRFGHRISVDLDLFCATDFIEEQILQEIKSGFNVQLNNTAKNTLNLVVDTVKVDVLSYKYPLLNKIDVIENIRLLSIEDIAAMKLSAVSSRGSRKDFFDLFFILKNFTMMQLIEFYKQKYQTDQYYHILKSLIYFEDADLEPDVQLVKPDLFWDDVKVFFEKTVNNFIRKS